MTISQARFNKVLELGLIMISVTVPFWMLFNNIAIIFTFFLSICNLIFYRNDIRKWLRLYNVYLFLFALMLIALMYTTNLEMGLVRLEQRLVFVIIPIICFSLSPIINRILVMKILKYFVWSTILATLVFVINAMLNTWHYASLNPFNEVNGNFFSYMLFTDIIEETHPIYFGTYVLFSIFIFITDFFKSDKILKISKPFRLILVLYLIFITFLLNSFLLSGLIVLLFIYIFVLLIKDASLNKFLKLALFVVALLTIAASSHFVIDKLNGLSIREDVKVEDFSGSSFTALKARVAKVYSSVELISNNFWLGVGPGDERDELMKYYEKNQFYHGIERKFNSHNQFLSEFISTGVFGALGILCLFFIIIKRGILTNNRYLISIGIIYFCFCLTESALLRNKGIIFLVYFSCLLFTIEKKYSPK